MNPYKRKIKGKKKKKTMKEKIGIHILKGREGKEGRERKIMIKIKMETIYRISKTFTS